MLAVVDWRCRFLGIHGAREKGRGSSALPGSCEDYAAKKSVMCAVLEKKSTDNR